MFLRAKNITIPSESALKIALRREEPQQAFSGSWQRHLSGETDAAPLEWRDRSGKKPEAQVGLSRSAASLGLIKCLFAQRTGAAA